jgi:hypothetical protein
MPRQTPLQRLLDERSVIFAAMLLHAVIGLWWSPPSRVAHGQTFYVAVDGNNTSGDGSAGNPWASVERALGVLHDNQIDGATVLVRPGTYGRQNLVGTFAQGVTVRSEIPYQARLRAAGRTVVAQENSRGASGITFEGFDVAHAAAGADPLVFHVDGGGGNVNVERLFIRNNVIHDSWNNDLLKINNGTRDVIVEHNMFYNQSGSDEHIDVNSVEGVVVRDNVFFNDFAGSGRTNANDTGSYIVIKDSNDDDDIFVGNDRVTVERNVFLNWEGSTGSNFVLVGEDGKPYIEARNVMVQNNLMLGNSPNVMRAALGVKSGEDVTFRNNTVVGDLPALAFAMRVNVENPAVTNDRIFFYNNIYSDPTGTMGAEQAGASNDFSDSPPGEVGQWQLQNNLYWNGPAPIPANGGDVINYTGDSSRIVADPMLPGQASLVLPRWNATVGEFADGSATVREAFVQLVTLYGRPGATSAGVDHALPAQAPADDVLGRLRAGVPDVGAFEWVVASPADFDEDGNVDGDDLLQWQGDFGPSSLSDADNDGDSDGADFLVWQQQLGSSLAAQHAVDAAPEPAARALAAASSLAMAAVRRRARATRNACSTRFPCRSESSAPLVPRGH